MGTHKEQSLLTHVSAGLIIQNDMILMSQRKDSCVFRGYWEFPGGKWEKDENGLSALKRELNEEIGIEVVDAEEIFLVQHDYTHATILLHFFRVHHYRHQPVNCEGQVLKWKKISSLDGLKCLPAGQDQITAYLEHQVQQAK